jgi:hypothetical protein
MCKYGDIDIILGKALGVLGHAELLEAARDLLHGAPVRRTEINSIP